MIKSNKTSDSILNGSFRFGLVTLLLICLSFSSSAQAASIFVKGTAGATLYLDSVEVATLPMSSPVELELGFVVIRLSLKGYLDHIESASPEDEREELTLDIELMRLSKVKATLLSLSLAGLGQRYEERNKSGWIFMSTQLAALATAIYLENEFKTRKSDYEDAYEAYLEHVSSSEVDKFRSQADEAWDSMENVETWRNTSLGFAATIALWSAVDAWMHFDSLYIESTALNSEDNSQAATLFDAGWKIGWRSSF